MIVRLDSAARDDIREATEWYSARDPKAATRFVAAVDAAITEIAEFPDGPPRLETCRETKPSSESWSIAFRTWWSTKPWPVKS